MRHWRTKLKLMSSDADESDEIPIRREIFQGYALSSLWFCLALNPLSNILSSSDQGLTVTYEHTLTSLTHVHGRH